MRIGFDAKMIFSVNSGVGNYGRSMIELLTKFFPENKYFLYSGFDDNVVGFEIPKGVEVVTPSSITGDVCPAFWRNFNMSGDIRARRLNIYHGLSNTLPYDIRFGGAKSVVTIHDLAFIRYPNLYSRVERVIFEKQYKRSCQYADMIIANSLQTKNDIINFWNIPSERISVVHQGCNSIFYERATDVERAHVRKKYDLPENYILSVGIIDERKNLMLTLHAIAEGNLDINLVACGTYTPYVETLMKYAVKAGITSRIKFIHDVSFADLAAIYQIARVTVYVSLFEGFGLPIIESINSSTPVITSKGGVFSETGGDACIYVGQYDLDDMIEALKLTIYDNKVREELIIKGKVHSLKFRDDIVAKNLMSVYEKIL